MAFAADIAADMAIFDGPITGTLTQKRAGEQNPLTITNVNTQPVSAQMISALGGLGITGRLSAFGLPANQVGSDGVQPGDFFNDGTNDWYIEKADLKTLSSRWDIIGRLQPPSTN